MSFRDRRSLKQIGGLRAYFRQALWGFWWRATLMRRLAKLRRLGAIPEPKTNLNSFARPDPELEFSRKLLRAVESRTPIKTAQELRDTLYALHEIDTEYRESL